MEYAPLPTNQQLALLANEISPGSTLRWLQRFTIGLGCTADLIEIVSPGGAPTVAEKVVLRRYGSWHTDNPGNNVVEREFTALRIAEANGVPVPEPIWKDENGIFAEKTVVISYIDGLPVGNPADPGQWVDEMAVALARIHTIPVKPDMAASLINLHELDSRRVEEKEPPDRFAKHPLGKQLWELQREVTKEPFSGTPTLVHSDFWAGNVLWKEDQLVGVIDWEDAAYGDPIADLAYSVTDLRYTGFDWLVDRFVDRYKAESGRELHTMHRWTVVALTRPLPDIGNWLPAWSAIGSPVTDVAVLRQRHHDLVQQAISDG